MCPTPIHQATEFTELLFACGLAGENTPPPGRGNDRDGILSGESFHLARETYEEIFSTIFVRYSSSVKELFLNYNFVILTET